MRNDTACLLMAIGLAGYGPAAHAQPAMIVGRVTADSLPLAGARVTLAGVTRYTTADGLYRFEVTPGPYLLEVRAIGYAPWSVRLETRRGDSLSMRVSLQAVAAVLTPVSVRSPSSNLEDFEARRARGAGTFFTPEDLRKMQPRAFTDVLRRVPGIYLRKVNTSFGESLTAMSSRTRPCPMAYILNGSPLQLPNEMNIDSYIAAHEVVAVEVYAGSSRIPTQFSSSASTAQCGVIVVWTRNGRER